jgi:hypothetical protein
MRQQTLEQGPKFPASSRKRQQHDRSRGGTEVAQQLQEQHGGAAAPAGEHARRRRSEKGEWNPESPRKPEGEYEERRGASAASWRLRGRLLNILRSAPLPVSIAHL